MLILHVAQANNLASLSGDASIVSLTKDTKQKFIMRMKFIRFSICRFKDHPCTPTQIVAIHKVVKTGRLLTPQGDFSKFATQSEKERPTGNLVFASKFWQCI